MRIAKRNQNSIEQLSHVKGVLPGSQKVMVRHVMITPFSLSEYLIFSSSPQEFLDFEHTNDSGLKSTGKLLPAHAQSQSKSENSKVEIWETEDRSCLGS